MTDHRSNSRKAVGLLVKLKYSGVDEFAERYATNLSDGGMFIRSREPKPVGTELKFRVEIANGERVLQGTGVVRWVRSPDDPTGAPGMGVQFETLDEASRALVDRMLASGEASRPPSVAPAIAPARAPAVAPAITSVASPRPQTPVPSVAPAIASVASAAPQTTVPSVAPAMASVASARPQPPVPSVAPANAPSASPAAHTPALGAPRPALPTAPLDAAALFELSLDEAPPAPSSPPVAFELDVSATDDPALPALEVDVPFVDAIDAEPQPPSAGANEIDVDLDSLLASTPPAAPLDDEPPVESSNSVGFEIDFEFAPHEGVEPSPAPPPVDAASAVTAPEPVSPAPLPELRREAARAPAPVAERQTLTTVAPAPPVPMAPQRTGPVYLTSTEPIADTGPVIGIDLGTTNSACAIVAKGRAQILRSKDGYNTIPSIVALSKNGRLEVGHRAKGQMVLNPTQSIFGAKRLVGRDFESPTVRHVRERSHFEIVADDANRAAVRLGANTLMLEEVQGLVLKECREMAEHTLGMKISRAVVTCPAYYSEPQREAVRRAGKLAGLKVERVLNEPTAAALAFGMNRELSKTVLVYDLGGGTFDATLLKIDKNVFEVLATGGDVFLGGTDFDNQIVDLLLQRFQTQHGRPFAGDQIALSRISEVAEKAKVALSEQHSFDVHLPMLELDPSGTPKDLKCTVTRADVEKASGALVERTIQAVHDVLLDAKLKPGQVDDVILVGGMSRMPLVREKLKAIFKKPPQASVNADEAVALGAALYSGSVDKVSSLVLIDVVPMTVGLGKPGGGFHRLIERNTPLPATKSFGLSTHEDNQTELEVMIFQGEDSNVAGNEFLGAMKLEGLPKGPKGSVQIAITISLDAECVLKVEAREFRTRKVVQTTLATRYTSDEVAKRLNITAEKRAQTDQQRAQELGGRAGGFWSKLKRVFSRG
ncbi:MAG: TIGR02266 family protein [Myxococcales bacterium]|nr:TIGR02266 family protein [Myxococcales bacterium]